MMVEGAGNGPFCAYIGFTRRELHHFSFSMDSCNFPSLQLGDKLVSYYPVKTIYGDISKEWCFRFISSPKDNSFSKKFLNRVEKVLDIREYIGAGYSFVGDNSNLPQLGNP